jgi:hypothetical protein
MRSRQHAVLANNLDSLTGRRLFNIAHISERDRPLWVKSEKARPEHLLSAYHPIATGLPTCREV